MKAAAAALLASVLLSGVSANFEACKSQATFDVRMCKSHMCGDCTLAWCMESCQKLQEEHSGCRCEDWPEARVSYSAQVSARVAIRLASALLCSPFLEQNITMKACPLKAVAGIVALMLVVVQGASEFEACKSQATFDVRMCKSHMCTDCTLAWCMESCQKLQEEHSSCRCMDWPEARKSYSGDGMKGAGKYGDIGDYSKERAARPRARLRARPRAGTKSRIRGERGEASRRVGSGHEVI
eukprot:CAMPEP_0177174044 /NCGR_PEP_ID=MMETSP0367-20130122/11968_1 /TAXON_ID=447022 ORGANISM="Scrippsiella hangoei-like, Strain SHHI-4" /NCGR_SAMPLE_ID=MMETSP0367 /ASSEMBLY_ACC=CAM_ASM_000362 /LENGTH=239 /DNA_ID=CAMNT_0018620375 /DNA_START=80 /DNA_END=798 /DNA_ORIENTATION=-